MEAQINTTLVATRRSDSGKGFARRLRGAGQVPAACYGRGIETLALAVNHDALREAISGPKGLNAVLEVEVDGGDLRYDNVILHDYQVDPVSRALLHVDLLVVEEGQLVEANVPVTAVGRARGERVGGKLRLLFPEIRVRSTASNIPVEITLDVTSMGPNAVRMASQLNYPEGVEPVFVEDFAIARIMMPRQNVVGLDDVEDEEMSEESVDGAEEGVASEGSEE